MSHQQIIAEVQQLLEGLPEQQVASVRDFAAFLAQQKDRSVLTELQLDTPAEPERVFRADLTAIIGHSKAYDFLNNEPDLYSDDDLIER